MLLMTLKPELRVARFEPACKEPARVSRPNIVTALVCGDLEVAIAAAFDPCKRSRCEASCRANEAGLGASVDNCNGGEIAG
jgi:hypothetical protein